MTDYTIKTLQRGPCTLTVCRPVLTPGERAKREKSTQAALSRVLHSYLIRKEREK